MLLLIAPVFAPAGGNTLLLLLLPLQQPLLLF
jgi:hypothetical protein